MDSEAPVGLPDRALLRSTLAVLSQIMWERLQQVAIEEQTRNFYCIGATSFLGTLSLR